MKIGKAVGASAIVCMSALGLTACDPPMPPDVAASLAELTYTCVEGDVPVYAEPTMQDLLWGWTDSLSYSCIDPEPVMTMSAALTPDEALVEISDYPSQCKPAVTVPLATEASVLIYMESEVSSLNLSPKSIAEIMSGKITNWNQLAKDNPGFDMPDYPLTVKPEADSLALETMLNYLEQQGIKADNKKFSAVEKPLMDDYAMLEEGQVAIVPNSYAVALGLYPANIYLGLDAEQMPILAVPDVSGIQTATTQWKISKTENSISVVLDPKTEPTPPDGSEVAPTPYQPIYAVNLNLCSDALLPRAVARFLLRLDSQGALGASNFAPLSSAVRVESLVLVSKGLPTPTPQPTE